MLSNSNFNTNSGPIGMSNLSFGPGPTVSVSGFPPRVFGGVLPPGGLLFGGPSYGFTLDLTNGANIQNGTLIGFNNLVVARWTSRWCPLHNGTVNSSLTLRPSARLCTNLI